MQFESALRTLEEQEDPQDRSVEDRIADTVSKAGPSVLLSSTTNIIAFALGAGTPMPALASFCIYTSVGMAADFIFQITFFIAVLTLDERRRRCGPTCSALPMSCCSDLRSPGRSVFQGAAKSLTSSLWLRTIVLVLWLALMVGSTVVAFDLKVGLEPQDLVPSSSPTAVYFQQLAVLPSEAEFPEVLVQHEDVVDASLQLGVASLEDASTQRGLLKLYRSLLASSDVVDASGLLWLNPRTESLTATRIQLLAKNYTPQKMLSLRATVDAANLQLQKAAFVYSPSDVYREQDAVLIQNTTTSLLFMLIAVLAAVFMLSFNFPMMAALTLALYSCCVHMLGWMVLTGLKLNSLSVIPLLLSVGLCVDYCAHIAHSFWHMPGDSKSRAQAALQGRGLAVLHAGVSTGLSQLPLAFSQSAVFTTFFVMMTGMVLVGLFHALLVLPICCSFLPEPPSREQTSPLGPESNTVPAKIGLPRDNNPT
ncbi:Ptchd3 [Symbiodinium pilosum]|uniref:Ptchd3 protein n=1 Tax=Symbiodinium pilosum TaxID=2952 RepID=A0A812MX59_SYMPI|nr:Ptchd3 [Symbiodinium pilosum]